MTKISSIQFVITIMTKDLMIKAGENIESVSVDELLHAQTHILNHSFRFISSFSLKCAVQLGIPDIIYNHGKPMIISDLASALSIHPSKLHHLYRLMRILIHSGFFAEQNIDCVQNDKGYVLTLSSRLLLKDKPLSLRPLLLTILDPTLTNPWECVCDWFRVGVDSAPFSIAHGMSLWDFIGSQPSLNHIFNEGMGGDSEVVASVVLSKCKGVFEGLKSLVDVGGGTGTMIKVLAKAFPNMDCVVFDLPHVVFGLQGSGNVKFVGGNMFGQIPPADAIMLKWILHTWNDEDCVEVLKVCKEAIMGSKDKGADSKVIIIDIVMESKEVDEQSKETELFFDMHMMVCPKGQERNEQEWSKLFIEAGFKDYKINHVLGLRSLIELFP